MAASGYFPRIHFLYLRHEGAILVTLHMSLFISISTTGEMYYSLMDRQSIMWEKIKYICCVMYIDFTKEDFGKHLVIVYVYLWLQAVPHNCIDILSIQLHCNDLIHSVHKIYFIKIIYTP